MQQLPEIIFTIQQKIHEHFRKNISFLYIQFELETKFPRNFSHAKRFFVSIQWLRKAQCLACSAMLSSFRSDGINTLKPPGRCFSNPSVPLRPGTTLLSHTPHSLPLFKYAEAVCRGEKYNKELYWDDRSNLMTVHAELVQSPGCGPFSSTKNTLLAVFVSNILQRKAEKLSSRSFNDYQSKRDFCRCKKIEYKFYL